MTTKAAILYLNVFIVALSLPTFTLAQDGNITTLPVEIIPSDLTAVCPSDKQIQDTLNTIRTSVQGIIQSMLPPPPCGDPSVWRKVILIDMSNDTNSCPTGLVFKDDPIRSCGRQENESISAVEFSVPGGEYSQVCGRIRGYQYGETKAFYSNSQLSEHTLDDQYLDGVSLTHGDKGNREHIWSFASGRTQNGMSQSLNYEICPCALSEMDASKHPAPDFLNGNYFCESGAFDYQEDTPPGIFLDDPLWDGQNCRAESRCCEFNSPPWFTKQLSTPTTDGIEFRLCLGSGSKEADIPIDLIELYVQ